MKFFSFINKETDEIIKFTRFSIKDDDFGTLYMFSENKHDSPWFSPNIEDLEFILKNKHIHPKYSMFYNHPSKEDIDFSKYKIMEFNNV